MSTDTDVALTPFSSTEVSRLRYWLVAPHVAKWYPGPESHVEWATNPPPGGDRALITVRGQPVGYLRWLAVAREVLDSLGLHEIPAGSVDVDILIGEPEFVGRGIGPEALLLLLSRLRHQGDVPLAGLTTSVQNISAQRAYSKVGFRILREYSPPGYGRCYLMIYDFDR